MTTFGAWRNGWQRTHELGLSISQDVRVFLKTFFFSIGSIARNGTVGKLGVQAFHRYRREDLAVSSAEMVFEKLGSFLEALSNVPDCGECV